MPEIADGRDSEMRLMFVPTSGVLQRRGHERVLQDVQRFVQISPRVFGGDASAEADSILWHCRIIDGRHPKTASAQFVAKAIHSFTVPNYNRHDVSRRCASINSELAELLVEIIGVLPKFFAQGRAFSNRNFQRLKQAGDNDRWQSARVNVGVRVKAKILQCLLGTGDESAQRTECL